MHVWALLHAHTHQRTGLSAAERWLTPGTEYAVPEKLPLPADWYKDLNAATEDADADMDVPGEAGAHGVQLFPPQTPEGVLQDASVLRFHACVHAQATASAPSATSPLRRGRATAWASPWPRSAWPPPWPRCCSTSPSASPMR